MSYSKNSTKPSLQCVIIDDSGATTECHHKATKDLNIDDKKFVIIDISLGEFWCPYREQWECIEDFF